MKKILVLWTTVRSTSTAFEKMIRQRGDFLVFHEPFGLSYYNSPERRDINRYPNIELNPEYSYQKTWQKLQQNSGDRGVFVKDMAYYVSHLANKDFLSIFENTFLIRDPAKMLPSLYNEWPDFTLEEAGYAELYNVFERVRQMSGKTPVVIDSDDLVQNPELTVKAYCNAVGIPFIKESLEWEPQSRPELSNWEPSWHGYLNTTSGFKAQKQKKYVSVTENKHLQHAYEFCLPYYTKIHKYKLQ
ncbi:hypothetical protein [Roseofilum casamattae]|uniref:Sulfotransferase family protein n=1 Tax=Roseofilum casamattae BLCC-M143 TaxID=3022442 RepID=A0ABT7BW14_9CYAN|nr:hypothetical protein [Roseofilum casamattae]MDJ1183389.1 sulfotransferase family protein [Roseofilum casamattae BLCC-M143]